MTTDPGSLQGIRIGPSRLGLGLGQVLSDWGREKKAYWATARRTRHLGTLFGYIFFYIVDAWVLHTHTHTAVIHWDSWVFICFCRLPSVACG